MFHEGVAEYFTQLIIGDFTFLSFGSLLRGMSDGLMLISKMDYLQLADNLERKPGVRFHYQWNPLVRDQYLPICFSF